jgi:NADPH:quinone reductase-like Zn-dependent oxidoreductase
MRAVVCTQYGPPEVLQVKDIAKPIPKSNEVLVKINATAVTPSDCFIRAFKVPTKYWILARLLLGFTKPRKILGAVLAGEVESAGQNVKRLHQGDQVYAFTKMRMSTYAEYTSVPENGVITLKPANLTFEEAAAIPYGGLLALHFLKKGNIENAKKVVIYGASGAIGTCALQLAKYFGAEVTAICSTANLEIVKSLGADEVVDYTKEDFTNNGKHYDLILNAVGKRKAQLNCANVLTPNGRHVTVDDGMPKLTTEALIFFKELVEAGKLKPVIDRTYPLEQIVEAHHYVEKGHKKGNVIITVEHGKT